MMKHIPAENSFEGGPRWEIGGQCLEGVQDF